MARLILTTSDSGAGCIKAAGLADGVVAFTYRLVSGPVPPATEPVTFFAARENLLGDTGDWERAVYGLGVAADVMRFVQDLADGQHIEIWADPNVNGQLQMIQLLTWLGGGERRTLSLVHVAWPIGEHCPEDLARLDLQAHPVEPAHLDLARSCMAALQQPTPESWFTLLSRNDLEILPYLRPVILRFLEELPASETALSLTEVCLLNVLAQGATSPREVMAALIEDMMWSVFDYWELGTMLDRLGRCACPAVAGIDGPPFDMPMHHDVILFERYRNSKLSLSPLGWDLIHRRADFSRFNSINQWWGGTRLSNDRLWRWDHGRKLLVPPS